MAVCTVVAENKEAPRRYGGRVTAFVTLSCITAGMGGVIFGYDIGVSGGVTSMDGFLRKFFPDVYRRMEGTSVSNYCKFDSELLTAFTSSLYIAGLVTTFLASWVTARCGRRPSMIVAGTAILAGSAIGGTAVNLSMVILGRVLLGVGLGFGNQAVPLYMSEMAPPLHRGAFSNGFQLCVGIGAVTARLTNFFTQKIRQGWGWRVSLAAAAVPGGFLTLGALFLPETPNSVLQQGKDHDTVRVLLRKIRGIHDVEDELNDIAAANRERASSRRGMHMIVTQRQYRPQLAMAIMIPFFQQVTGINAISFYAPVLLRTIGMGESASLLSVVVTGLVGTTSTLLSMFLVDRFGRRTLFLVGGVQMLASQLMIGGIMTTQLGDHGQVSRTCAFVLIFLIAVYVAGFAWSWGPLGWLVPSEIFPLEVRSAGQSITVAVNFLMTTAVAQLFLPVLCRMKAGIFFFFAAWLVAMTAFVYLLLPETKGLPIEQVGRLWSQHWFWRRFVTASDGEQAELEPVTKVDKL
ncbi:hexose carrier protein HEX6-like isoform X3 [Oryza brachyantha]|uniref:hexose carrier protein HEX6-like isoform X3 n=1 Tax=Oryza brachyantha TaxID=4533 RepID=UPI001ADC3236|nr:hexose carrier protein HEX6-like isoform X3 [Oryza brachyantha]XP_040383225.1 hexose carrier protein HEX6-like isoform X3 [Oryza brachyantha]XP_040383226.1 hexose carrier protein HEX6-like isoform X3 [Oryza brachyantha]